MLINYQLHALMLFFITFYLIFGRHAQFILKLMKKRSEQQLQINFNTQADVAYILRQIKSKF
jgi:hypothetical protein